MKWIRVGGYIVIGFVVLFVIVAGLFVMNGIWLANNETPVMVRTSHWKGDDTEISRVEREDIKILAYNIAKGFIHKGGTRFATREEVLNRLQDIADIINAEQPDLVFLSEVIFECGPTHVNQAEFLAEATGMNTVLWGENYNVGLPFFRIVGGNAILSRVPITPVGNPSLAGRKPFYVTKNNRRILWGEIRLEGENVLVGAVHNDSFNLANNLTQMQQILEFIGERPAMLGGDFNANPDEAPMQLLRKSEQFSGMFEGPPTFSTHQPHQTIDFIVAPSNWEFLEHRVIQSDASDHLPVVSIFRRKM